MADNCIKCDVAIVGSGFAGALIANELSQKGIKVVILEAGAGVPPNINDYMAHFYKASAKVPESAFPPEFVNSKGDVIDPAALKVRFDFAAPPTGLSLTWSCGTLQSTPALIGNGPGTVWTDVPNAASPFTVDPKAAAAQFYRITY